MIDLRELIARIQNKDSSETFDPATDSLEAIRDYLATVIGPGLSMFGQVTSVTDATHFESTDLTGFENDAFHGQTPWWVFVFRTTGAAAPQGEWRVISDYLSATGQFTHSSFSVNLVAGDYVMILHGSLIGAIIGSHDGKLWYDQNNGAAGTDYPMGTAFYPSNTPADLRTLAMRYLFWTIIVRGTFTVDASMEGYEFIGHGAYTAGDTIAVNGQDVDASIFRDLNISGAFGGSGLHTFERCGIINPTNICGLFRQCAFQQASFRDNIETDVYDGFAFQGTAALTFSANTKARFFNWHGAMSIASVTGGTLDIFCSDGHITIAASCTGGTINIYGNCTVDDSSAGTTVNLFVTGGGAEGLVYLGEVDTFTDANNFASDDLTAYGDDYFVGWWVMCLWDATGAGGAPQGEYKQITDYDSGTGTITHGAFSANLAVTDKVLLIHPAIYEALTIRGGSGTIQSVLDEWDAQLDLARSANSGDYTMDGTEITLYEENDAHPFQFCGAYIDWTGLNAGGGEDTTVKMYVKIASGGAWRQIYEETFLAAAVPAPPCTPVPRDVNTQCTPGTLYNVYGVKITATQAAVGGGWNDIPIEIFDAKRG